MFRQFFWMTGAIIWAGSVGSFVSVRTLSTELLWSFIVWMIKSSIFIVEQHRVLQNIPYMSHLIGFGFDLLNVLLFCFDLKQNWNLLMMLLLLTMLQMLYWNTIVATDDDATATDTGTDDNTATNTASDDVDALLIQLLMLLHMMLLFMLLMILLMLLLMIMIKKNWTTEGWTACNTIKNSKLSSSLIL